MKKVAYFNRNITKGFTEPQINQFESENCRRICDIYLCVHYISTHDDDNVYICMHTFMKDISVMVL